MTATERQLFEQTRLRIQNNLAEVTDLSQRTLEPRAYFARFLELAVDSLQAEGGAVWIPQGQDWQRFADRNFASCQFENPVQQNSVGTILREITKTKKQYVIGVSDPAFTPVVAENEVINPTRHPFFYTPVLIGERLPAVLQIWLREAGDPKTYGDIASFLAGWVSHAATFLRHHQVAVTTLKNEELSLLVRMQSSLLGELNPKEVASVLTNYSSDLLKADLVCLFKRRARHWRLIAASNQDVIDEKSQQARRLVDLAEALPLEEKAQVAAKGSIGEELKEPLQAVGYEHAAWKVLKAPGHHGDHLICAFKHEEHPFANNTPELMDRIGEASGKALDSAHHHHGMPFRVILGKISRIVGDWRASRRRRTVVFASIVVLAGVLLFAIPVPLKITTECAVEPHFRALAVAEAPGKIIQVSVNEGQQVEKGQLLAKLEDTDFVTQLAVAQQERLRWQVEAARAQSADSEADRKLAEVNFLRATEAINRLEYQRSKTEVRAPMAGVIMTKNLRNREGEAMEKGSPFCEIAGAQDYDLVLEVKQADIGDLLETLHVKHKLPVDFILHSHSQTQLSATIDGDDEISQLPEMRKDHSVFLVRIPFPKGSTLDPLLKSGYTGKAKIRLGQSSLAYAWFRPFLNYWRVEWSV